MKSIHCRMTSSTRDQMEVQTTCTTSPWKIVVAIGQKLYEMYTFLGNRSITGDILLAAMCLVEKTNRFLLGNKKVCLKHLTCAEDFNDHRKLFPQTEAYSNFIWDKFRRKYLQN